MNEKRIAWITGASSGIGEALAQKYNAEHYFVILSGRSISKLENTRNSLAYPENAFVFPFDVVDPFLCEKKVLELKSKFDCPDIIILNAGISQRALAQHTTIEVSKKIIETNLLSNIAITKTLFPELIDRPRSMVIISSVAGKVGPMLRSTYAASKHGLHGYFDSLRAENHDAGLSVTIVCPGYVHTDISLNALTGDGSKQGTMDVNTKNGVSPQKLALKVYKAQQRHKSEIYIGGFEVMAIYLRRFIPKLLERLIRKSPPK